MNNFKLIPHTHVTQQEIYLFAQTTTHTRTHIQQQQKHCAILFYFMYKTNNSTEHYTLKPNINYKKSHSDVILFMESPPRTKNARVATDRPAGVFFSLRCASWCGGYPGVRKLVELLSATRLINLSASVFTITIINYALLRCDH